MTTLPPPSVLETIVAAARRRVEVARERLPLDDLEARVATSNGERRAARAEAALRGRGVRVIAECKRRSPSKGILRHAYDPASIATAYQSAGAAAISVLTEPAFFDGDLTHLEAVRARVSVPVLRKDFTVDRYQIAEAHVAGADLVLLIVAALDQASLTDLLAYAGALDMGVLVEVHDEDEARRAVDAGARIIGVNNRNLKTLAVSLETSHRVARDLPASCIRVAESGLRTGADLAGLAAAGFDAFLMGERFMTEPDPGAALAQVLGDAARAMAAGAAR
jgi:indole-3-glycerol phosphate synthase